MLAIPIQFRHLFWDVDISTLDSNNHAHYIIARVLEYGDEESSQWLKRLFPENQIIDVIKTERRLSKKSAQFWAGIYQIPLSEVTALKTQ